MSTWRSFALLVVVVVVVVVVIAAVVVVVLVVVVVVLVSLSFLLLLLLSLSLSLFSVVACQVLVVVDVAAGGCGGCGGGACWCVLGATLNKKNSGGGLGGRAQRLSPNAFVVSKNEKKKKSWRGVGGEGAAPLPQCIRCTEA